MKRSSLLFSLLIFSTVTCFAQSFSYNLGGLQVSNYYEEIPYESINGKIFLQVEVAGKAHKFLFDTGAPCALSPELVSELNATIIHKDLVRDAVGDKDSLSAVLVDEIKIGNLRFMGIPAIDIFPDFYRCWGIEGVIGSNLLRNSIVRIDASRHLIIFTDQPEKLNLNPKKAIPLITKTNYQSDPQIQIKLKDKVNLTLGFDTGDNTFLRMSEELMKRVSKLNVYQVLQQGYGSSTISVFGLQKNAEKYLIKIPFIQVGDARFNEVITSTDKGAIPAVGAKLLEYGIVTLDFIHGKFYFDPKQEKNEMFEKQWPIQPTVNGKKFIVGLVWDKMTDQIKAGEQILAIDDKDYSEINICNLMQNNPVLYGKEAAVLTLKDDKGSIRKVRISKE
eukprot:gene11834-13795_t